MTDEKIKKFGFFKRTWQELKRLAVTPMPIKPGQARLHPGAIQGDKILPRPHAHKTGKPIGAMQSNHERIISLRADRMRISVTEYKRRFCLK